MAKKKSLKERMAEKLSASDINYLLKNAENYTIGFLTTKLGKPAKMIEKELKKHGLKPLDAIVIQAAAEEPAAEEAKVVVEITTGKEAETPKVHPRKQPYMKAREFVKNHHAELTIREMAEQTGVTETSIINYLKELGLSSKPGKHFFTPEDVEYLRANSGKKTVKQIADALGRSVSNVEAKMSVLKLSTRVPEHMKPFYVTQEQIEYIKKYNGIKTVPEITKDLNLPFSQVRKVRRKYGLEQPAKKTHFTQNDLAFIEQNYRLLTKREMAYYLKKTPTSIAYQMDIHNWVLTAEETKKLKSRWTKENISPPLTWTPIEEAFIRYNFGKIPFGEMANQLKTKTRSQIGKIAKALGLEVKPEHMSKFNSMNAHKGNEVLRERKQKAKSSG
ncbi:MAG: hypothetical protein MUF45_03860 [Spirosomaceae bacterium]|jgi:hypothetical protein|nr:hypothetical protein [Spirosomataceae bacterium]